jgi:hypothetical protein
VPKSINGDRAPSSVLAIDDSRATPVDATDVPQMSSVLGRIGKTGGATAQSFGGVTPYSWIGRSEALAWVGNDMWASRTLASKRRSGRQLLRGRAAFTDSGWPTSQSEVSRARWRVRDVSKLGACRGQTSAVRSDRSENNARPRVRSLGQLGGESSKRVQTGEPMSCRSKRTCLTGFIAMLAPTRIVMRRWPPSSRWWMRPRP